MIEITKNEFFETGILGTRGNNNDGIHYKNKRR